MTKMFKIAVVWSFVAAAPAVVSAQTVGVGYAFGSPGFVMGSGDSTPTLHFGGGGEVRIRNTIGIGADVGFLGPFEALSAGVGLFSANGSYYFPVTGQRRRAQPFVTGGYSMMFREGSANLWNFGGGADYWTTKTFAIRFEMRDHMLFENGQTMHLWGPRIGLVWLVVG